MARSSHGRVQQYSVNPNGSLKRTLRPMPLTLTDKIMPGSRPVHLVTKANFAALELDAGARAWAEANGFSGKVGQLLVLPGADGSISGALFGVADKRAGFSPLATGALAR